MSDKWPFPKNPWDVSEYLVAGKRVFIFGDHASAIEPWSWVRSSLPTAPILFTLDFHTDTCPSFLGLGSKAAATEKLKEVDILDASAVHEIRIYLKNDEHINTAINLNVLDAAFVLAERAATTRSVEYTKVFSHFHDFIFKSQDEAPSGSQTYAVPADRVFYLPNVCFIGCTDTSHDECDRRKADQAIESTLLNDRLVHCDEMIKALKYNSLLSSPYILDIDLDYFRTKKALTPNDPSTFYKLVRNAQAITIALEPVYVDEVKIDSELDASYSLSMTETPVKNALKC